MIIVASMIKALLLKLVTQAMFEYILVETAELAAKSTKTDFDDKLVEKIKEALKAK